MDREALHYAVQTGDLNEVHALIAQGFDVNAFDFLGETPLHYAVKRENVELAKLLLGNGANVNAHDERMIGNTPLGDVAGNCSLAIAQLLIDHGADPTIPGWMQVNALHKAKKRKRGDGPAVYRLLVARARKLGYHLA